MTEKEITANYGAMIDNASNDKKTYISKELNLKFIPDKVSFTQYITVLLKSPEYLLKFWNSVILVVPITIFSSIEQSWFTDMDRLFSSPGLYFRKKDAGSVSSLIIMDACTPSEVSVNRLA